MERRTSSRMRHLQENNHTLTNTHTIHRSQNTHFSTPPYTKHSLKTVHEKPQRSADSFWRGSSFPPVRLFLKQENKSLILSLSIEGKYFLKMFFLFHFVNFVSLYKLFDRKQEEEEAPRRRERGVTRRRITQKRQK